MPPAARFLKKAGQKLLSEEMLSFRQIYKIAVKRFPGRSPDFQKYKRKMV